MTYINRISNISFVHQSSLSLVIHNSWRKVWNFLKQKFLGIFTKIDITFSYRIGITKFLARWKACYECYVMTWSRVSFGFSIVSSSCDLRNLWFILLGFSCDGTCLSWIEFIVDLSMWASILVYIFEVIMEDMMMRLHTFMIWYSLWW